MTSSRVAKNFTGIAANLSHAGKLVVVPRDLDAEAEHLRGRNAVRAGCQRHCNRAAHGMTEDNDLAPFAGIAHQFRDIGGMRIEAVVSCMRRCAMPPQIGRDPASFPTAGGDEIRPDMARRTEPVKKHKKARAVAAAIECELHGLALRWSKTRFALPSERGNEPISAMTICALNPYFDFIRDEMFASAAP